MSRRPRSLTLAAAVLAASCGGGSGSPTGPMPAAAPPAETFTVTVDVFDDENNNGRNDVAVEAWVPDVEVEIAGQRGRAAKRSGRATVSGIPRGRHAVRVSASTLPPYYVAERAVTVDVPPATPAIVDLPLRLPIGDNRPGVYFASGDSISQGEGSTDGRGFRDLLQRRLEDHFARGTVRYLGGGGGRTGDGARRLAADLDALRPAYTMLAWGTNDWFEGTCGSPTAAACGMEANLRWMIRTVRDWQSLPCLATLPPVRTGFNDNAPPSRNVWIREANELILRVAREERVLVIDRAGPFFQQESRWPQLFADDVHPSDAGYEALAQIYFEALTRGAISR